MDATHKRLLIKKRGLAKSTVSRIANYVERYDTSSDINLIRSRLDQVLNVWEEYNQSQYELEINDEEDHAPDREAFEEAYHAVKAKMSTLLEPANISATAARNSGCCSQASANTMRVKLPTINLPTFSGEYSQWIHFKDIFISLVIDNTAISNVQKFHYLLSSLSGEAHALIKSLPVCEANFTVAWDMLVGRYHNDRLIASQHVQALLNLPMVTRESASELRALINQLKGNMNAIAALQLQTPLHEILLSQLLLDKVDVASRKQWESTVTSKELPSLESLCSFVEQRCQALEVISAGNKPKPNVSTQSIHKEQKPAKASYVSTTSSTCSYCNGTSHRIHRCAKFVSLNVQQRFDFVKGQNLCCNCLQDGHRSNACKSSSCKTCDGRHHTMLHFGGQTATGNAPTSNPAQTSAVDRPRQGDPHQASNSYCAIKEQPRSQVLLSTVLVRVCDNLGQLHTCRALLDSASQSHFVSESLAQRLRLTKHHNRFPIHGINDATSETKYCVTLDLQSTDGDYKTSISCSVLPRITGNTPAILINPGTWGLPTDINLADPTFNQPGTIDLLIGAEIFFDLMLPQQRTRLNHPVLQNTRLGWIVSGRVQLAPEDESKPHESQHSFLRSDDILQRFWEVEEITVPVRSNDERLCETHFVENTTRDSTGRFVVRLPLKQDPTKLGDSYGTSRSRLYQIERRLARDAHLDTQYRHFLDEYENLGQMQEVSHPGKPAAPCFYLPHHPVIKESSTSTKVRVVFDASAKTSNGTSLNDMLLVGPTIQQDLMSIVLRFRLHQFVFTADISKMYRQIKVNAADYDLQRILWGRNEQGSPREYQLTTVTYGTASAPFLATRCLQQLADDEQHRFPKAAPIVRRDMYIDDVLTGHDTIDEALELQAQLIDLLDSSGFPLRKWCANHPRSPEGSPRRVARVTASSSAGQRRSRQDVRATVAPRFRPAANCERLCSASQ
jgi:Protein of unknown function (DUF1759)/Putative peptidase (DUF1758)